MTTKFRFRHYAVIALALGVGAAAGCSDDDDFGILEGSVTLNGSGIRGVTVEVAGDGGELTLETGALGGYVAELDPGEYTVTLTEGLPPEVECSPGLSQDATVSVGLISEANFGCETTAE
ncbi:MAG: hypothetical protein AAGF92_06260 [Myxococcota bacterium]